MATLLLFIIACAVAPRFMGWAICIAIIGMIVLVLSASTQ